MWLKSLKNNLFSKCSLSIIVLMLLNVCCEKEHETKASKHLKNYIEINENTFKEIHALNYENPLEARKKSIGLLDSISPNSIDSQIKLLKYIGSSYVFESNYPEAITYYNRALNLAEKTENSSEIANLNNNLGMIYNELGSYKSAYNYYMTAIDHYDLSNNKDKKIGTYNNIGVVYLNLKNYDKALDFFDKVLDSTILNKDTILVASVLNNMAICYSQNNSQLAFKELRKAIELSEKVNNQYGLCISYQVMGNIHMLLDDYVNAFEAYSKSIEIAENSNLYHQKNSSKIGLGNVLLKQGEVKKSLQIAQEVMDVASEQNSLVLKSKAHLLLSEIYTNSDDYKNGLTHYKDYVKAQEELTNQAVISQIYDLELSSLSRLNTLQQLELDKKELLISKKNNLLIFIILVFVLLIIGLYLLYKNHKHKQNVKLQKTIIDLTQKKSHTALEAEIRERKRIGQELHDSLGYLLSLAALHVSVLQKKKNLSQQKKEMHLGTLMDCIDEAFEEVRNISHNLSPSLLSELGLKGVLKNISDKVNQSSTLKMEFDTYGVEGKLDELIENVLYRCIQEIVNNTIKHSFATELFVQITKGESQIILISEDNGKGFEVDKLKGKTSFGLHHLKSSIESLNGNIHVDSKLNRGTIISIYIPLK